MSTGARVERSDLSQMAPWRLFAEAGRSMVHNPAADTAARRRMGKPAYMRNLISWLSLWISLLVAIWFVRGWIGLFFSGQVLSAGACLFQILTRRTCHAFSESK